MTEIVKYLCDECGEEFTDEEVCRKHEHMERLKNLNVSGSLHLFDCHFHPVDYTNPRPDWWLDEIWNIVADTEDAVQWFNSIAYENGVRQLEDGPGNYFWSDADSTWIHLDTILQKYNEKLAEFEKAVRNESESK